MRLGTKLVNLETGDQYGATNTPVYLNNSFEHETAEKLEKVFNQQAPGYIYSLFLNAII